MPWTIKVSLPVRFSNRCVICDCEEAVTTITSDHKVASGINSLGITMKDLLIQVPVGPKCDRKMRVLGRVFWLLFAVPWIVVMSLPLVLPNAWMGTADLRFLYALIPPTVIAYAAFYWRWWLRRAVRLIELHQDSGTIAVRHESLARAIGKETGAEPKYVFWTG